MVKVVDAWKAKHIDAIDEVNNSKALADKKKEIGRKICKSRDKSWMMP